MGGDSPRLGNILSSGAEEKAIQAAKGYNVDMLWFRHTEENLSFLRLIGDQEKKETHSI